MRFRKTVGLALAVVMIATAGPLQALASVSGEMNSFFDSSVTAANVTGPTAYEGQAASYYTLGNVSLRTQQKTLQLASIQLPSARGGCGGIDLFTGGMSFISSAELVAFLKAAASSAVSYAFMLALEAISPQLANNLKEIAKKAQEINAFNMSSCEAGQALVGAIGKAAGGNTENCANLATMSGTYSDRLKARMACTTGGQMNTVFNHATPEQKAVAPIPNKNIAWEAIKKHPLLSSDHDMATLFMTMTGTVIYTCPDTGADGCTFKTLPAFGAEDKGIISKLLDGGTIRVHTCGSDYDACLAPVAYAGSVTLAANKGMRARVSTLLTSITQKILDRTALTANEKDFLQMVSLPVYKMASVYTAKQRGAAVAQMNSYADIIALDLLYSWMSSEVSEIKAARSALTNIPEEQGKEWDKNISDIQVQLQAKQLELDAKGQAITQMISATQSIEASLASSVSSDLANSLAFNGGLGGN